jgi:hypothetical protein
MLRLTCLKRGLEQGEQDASEAMREEGLSARDVDGAISHCGEARGTAATVTIHEL